MEEEEDDEDKERPEYFYRLICLVVDLGTDVLLKLFLKDIPQGQTVEAFLNSKANVLNSLKKKVFNDIQLGILNAASPDVSRFDISLLYILISNLTNIQSPTGGWYIVCPIPSDQSAGALLMNLRRVRNEAIAHSSKGKMKKSDFEKYWNDTKDILIELAGEVSQAEKDSVKDEIDRTKVKELVSDKRYKLEALLLWAEQDRNCETMLSILEDVSKKIYQQGSVLGDIGPIKSSLQAVEAQINTIKFDQQSIVREDIIIKSYVQTNTDQVKKNTDQLKTNTDQVKTNTDQLKTNTDQVKTNTDQLKTNTDKLKTNTDLLETNTYQLKKNTDQVKTNTDQVKTTTDQVKTNTGQLKTYTDQLKTNTDLLDTNTYQLKTNTGQLKTYTDQLKANTDQLKTNTDLLETHTYQVKTNTDQLKTLTDQIRQIPETSSRTEFDQQSIVQEDIKSNLQTNTDQLKTNTDQLKTLTDQIRQIPGTSSGSEVSFPETIYTRPKKRTSWKPFAKKRKSGAIQIKNSHENKGNSARDQEDRDYIITKNKLRTDLIDHYKVTGCCTTAVPTLLDGEEVHIDEIFVMPSMSFRENMAIGIEGRTRMRGSSEVTKLTSQETEDVTTGSITTIHELFEKDGQSLRRICVSGDAGQGKTTLCRKIVSSWCKVHSTIENVPDTEHQFLKSVDVLFYLPLRNNRLSDVIEMIKTEIVRKASHNALKQVLEKESENCLIILDGLDEWLPSTDCKRKVPYMDPREKFTVMITSRPWKLEVLRPKMSEIGQEVKLNGIKKNKLIEAIVNVLNCKNAKNRNWKYFKNEKYYELKHLTEIPIILTQMVCMWYDKETFGNTHVEIYSKMLDYLFHVANKRHQEMFNSAWMRPQRSTNKQLVNVFKGLTFCEMYSEILFQLSDLAYHTLFNAERENSLVFPHSVTEIYKLAETDVTFCLFVGILSQTKSLCTASSHTKVISFIHKTFQEFLAALYIAYGGKDRSFNVMLESFKSLDDVFEMSQVLIFLSGLRPDLLGDMSRHIAQLTDKDERILQYRNSLRDRHNQIIVRLQTIIYDCIIEVPEHSMLDTKVELRDFHYVFHYHVYYSYFYKYNVKQMIPYLNIENIKSWSNEYHVGRRNRIKLKGPVLVKLCHYFNSQTQTDHVASIVDRYATTLTCLSVGKSYEDNSGILNMNSFLIALHKVSNLTCFELKSVNLTHSDIEYLGKILSQSTQLREISHRAIRCTTCQRGQCNYRIDLSHHKQLLNLSLFKLDGDIVLSNEVPVEHCNIHDVKCAVSILDRLKSSTSLQEFVLNMENDTDNGTDDDIPLHHTNSVNRSTTRVQDDDIPLHHTNSVTSSTTSVHDNERELHPTQLCVYTVLTDVIPTLENLRILDLENIDFKQDILRLSPEMTSLEKVSIGDSTMTLQCLQGFIDSLPKTQFDVEMLGISICYKEDTSTALKYITDRHQIRSAWFPSHMTKDGRLNLDFTNRPPH